MIEKNVTLWLGAENHRVRVPVSQYDTMWTFVFTVVNGSVEWEIPEDAAASLNGVKPDGNVFAFAGTVEDNRVVVDTDVQMTACAGDTICELSITHDDKVIGTANFVLVVEKAPKQDGSVISDSNIDAYGAVIADEVGTYIEQHPEIISGSGLTDDVKQALLALLEKVVYVDEHGQDYLDALELALYPPKTLVSISAVFSQGSNAVYNTDTLDSLKRYLTVTAHYDDYTSAVVGGYVLSGTLTVGTSVIEVTYGGKSTSFSVTVTADPLPSDYTKVLYVASPSTTTSGTGSGSYCNTQVTPTQNGTLVCDIGFMITENYSTSNYIIGSLQKGSSASVGWGVCVASSAKAVIAFNGISSSLQYGGASLVNTRLDVTATFTTTSSSITDGVDTVETTGEGRGKNMPIHLFGIKRSAVSEYTYPARGRVYYAKVYDNGNMILNVVPCTRNSDSTPGFYDYVNERFITSTGLVAGTTE